MRAAAAICLFLAAAACGPGDAPGDTDAPAQSAEPNRELAVPPRGSPGVAPGPQGALTPYGWGPLRIGMTLDQVTAALGPDADPDAVGGPDPLACDQFRPERAPEGLMVMIERERLTRVSLLPGSDIKTGAGIGVGDTAEAVREAYVGERRLPHAYQAPPAVYIDIWEPGVNSTEYPDDQSARGIRFEIDSTGKVAQIHVGGPSIQKVEGCV